MFETNRIPPVSPEENQNQSVVNEALEMKIQSDFVYFGGISILYGILFTFSLYRNLFGGAFLLYAIGTVSVLGMFLHRIDQKVKKETKIYFTAIVLCAVSTCLTASGTIWFFNWCFIAGLLLMAMISQFFEKREWDAFAYLRYLLSLFFHTAGSVFLPFEELGKYIHNKRKVQAQADRKTARMILIGLLCAAGALCVIFPLLLSSDMIFEKMFGGLFDCFRLVRMIPNLNTAIGISVMTLLGFAMIYAFFYASCKADFPLHPERKMPYAHPAVGITFVVVIAAVYLMYSVIQIVYLFMGRGLPEGITYSEYARAGFWQLVAVAFINVGMVLICMYLFPENKWLKGILTVISGCTFIMMLSAAYRMYLYVSVYHLTILRVLVFWALGVLALVMSGIIVSIYEKSFRLIPYAIGVIVCGYLILSFSQPDRWIAKYNINHMETITYYDLCDMMEELSLDAAPVLAELSYEDIAAEEETGFTEWEAAAHLYHYFKTISEENADLSLRRMNLSKIRAKRAADEYLKRSREFYNDLGISE